ncbi:hypothetical protein [Actinophytocola oryzae]|uniref:hypothetical protein n=1 Tax=Actinophytocola oryzae TaxID=502181 RepID=UPI001063D0CD|nr:hypothetical protein [Actinophytocola oryzae]
MRQANEAKKSRTIAQQAVEEAAKTRKATEQQAVEATKAREIAEEALAMAKQSEAHRVADRDARDAPKYDIVPNGRLHVRVTLMDGPPEVVMHMTRLDIVAQGDNRPEVPLTLAPRCSGTPPYPERIVPVGCRRPDREVAVLGTY